MKMIFKQLMLAVALLSATCLQAQDVPAFPSNETLVQWVKDSYFFKPDGPLKTVYGVSDLSAVKVSATAFATGDNGQVPVSSAKLWRSYTSERAAELFYMRTPVPHDMCESIVTITTPKQADGVYYDISVLCIYTRLKSDALTNTWSKDLLKQNHLEIRNLNIPLAVKEATFLDAVRQLPKGAEEDQFTLAGSEQPSEFTGLMNVFKIESLVASKSMKDKYISPTEHYWIFDVDAKSYADFEQIEEEGAMTMKNGKTPGSVQKPNLTVALLVKKDNGKWIPMHLSATQNGGEEIGKFDGNYFGVLSDQGVDNVYKKSTPAKLTK